MKTLYFATSNKWKFKLANDYFSEKGINLKQFEIEIPESRAEEGEEIAKEKADYTFSKLRKPLFVLDGSMHIRALNNFPKSYIKFMYKYIGAEGLLRLMEGKKDRYWEIFNIVCYKDSKVRKIFIGAHKGKVSQKLNHNKSGLIWDFDRVLVPDGYNKTFAEFTKDDVNEFDRKVWKQGVFEEFITWYKKLNRSFTVQIERL